MPRSVSTRDLVRRLLERGRRYGAEPQDPSGIKIEVGEEEDDAPRLVQFGASEKPQCCERDGVRGIEVAVTISVTDRDSGDESSGVRRACVKPLTRQGAVPFPPPPGWGRNRWTLTDEERTQTKSGSASHTFRGCVPCGYFLANRTVRFEVFMEDQEGNISVQVIGITVGKEIFEECC